MAEVQLDSNLTLPMLYIEGWLVFQPKINASLSTPLWSITGELTVSPRINVSLTMPFFTASATLDTGIVVGVLDKSLYAITCVGYGGGYLSKNMPSIGVAASGEVDIIGSLSRAIPRIGVTAAAHQEGNGTANITIPYLIIAASGFISPVGNLEKDISVIRLTASAIAGIVGNLEKEIGAIVLDSSSYWQDDNGSILTMPALRLYAHAQSAIWEVIALNVKIGGITNYDNYNYNSLSLLGDYVHGAKSDGIYLLSGSDDDGEDISWSLKTGKIDIENNLSQRARHIWFSRRSSGDLLLIVHDGEHEYEYPVTAYSEIDDAVRVKLGKGLRSKYVQLELKNLGNETLRLDSLKLFADKRPRQR